MKKMRKLIPAFAMLLVSAIMMSTASFAWFTMNEEVTATGMEIQAKATGSLVIGDAPLQEDDVNTTVDFNTSVTELKPIYLNKEDGKWYKPSGNVDPDTGLQAGATGGSTGLAGLEEFAMTNATKDGYIIDKEIYIGSAGDALTGQEINVTFKAPIAAEGKATLAYAAAVYVILQTETTLWADNAPLPLTEIPDAIVHVDTAENRNTATLTLATDGYTIPSVVGVQGENTTGLKIVIRFFVDGNLESVGDEKKEVVVGGYDQYTPLENNGFEANKVYYTKTAGATAAEDVYTIVNTSGLTAIPQGATWYVWNARQTVTQVNYKYINSADVPVNGSTLSISFSCDTDANAAD